MFRLPIAFTMTRRFPGTFARRCAIVLIAAVIALLPLSTGVSGVDASTGGDVEQLCGWY